MSLERHVSDSQSCALTTGLCAFNRKGKQKFQMSQNCLPAVLKYDILWLLIYLTECRQFCHLTISAISPSEFINLLLLNLMCQPDNLN